MQTHRRYSLVFLFLTCGIGCFACFPACRGLPRGIDEEKQMTSDVNMIFISDSLGRIFVQEAYPATNILEIGDVSESVSPSKTVGVLWGQNGETKRYVLSIFDPAATGHIFQISQPNASVRGFSPMWFSTLLGDVLVVHCSTDTHFDCLYALLPECREGTISCNLLYMTPFILHDDINHFYIQQDTVQLSASGVLSFTVFCSSQSNKSSLTTQVSIPLFWHPIPREYGQKTVLGHQGTGH